MEKLKKKTKYVVIDSHASPFPLSTGTEDIQAKSDILKLKKKVKKLILLGCNAGHQEYKYTNIAFYFSKRITGQCVASDGTVSSDSEHYKSSGLFESLNDNGWNSYNVSNRASNDGWVKYYWYGEIKKLNKKKMTLKSLLRS